MERLRSYSIHVGLLVRRFVSLGFGGWCRDRAGVGRKFALLPALVHFSSWLYVTVTTTIQQRGHAKVVRVVQLRVLSLSQHRVRVRRAADEAELTSWARDA